VSVGALAILAAYLAALGMLFLLPQYVQYVQDHSALAAGFELAPYGVGLGALSVPSGRLVARHGPRPVLVGGCSSRRPASCLCCSSRATPPQRS
jgi:MFS family permease